MMIDWFVVLTPLLLPIALLLLFVGCSLEQYRGTTGTAEYPPLRLNYTKAEAIKIKGMATVAWVLKDGAGKILGRRVEEAAIVSFGGRTAPTRGTGPWRNRAQSTPYRAGAPSRPSIRTTQST